MVSILATAVLAVGLVTENPQPLQWEASYGKALEATRAEGGPLLVVLDKPNSKSARIEPALLGKDSDGSREAELLRPYRLCHVDVTSDYGHQVARAFRAERFPHVAIIDRSGSHVVFRRSGAVSADEWERALTRHRNGDRTRTSLVSRASYREEEPARRSSASAEVNRGYRPVEMGFGNPMRMYGGSFCPTCR